MMECLNQVAPEIDLVSVVMNPNQRPHVEMWRAIEEVAPRFSVRLTASHVRLPAELEPALKAIAVESRRGLIVLPNPITEVHLSQVVTITDGGADTMRCPG